MSLYGEPAQPINFSMKDAYWIKKTENGPVRIEIPSESDIQGECVRVEEPKQLEK